MSSAHDEGHLAHLDLNLLVALDVLLALKHVTQAADRLGVTQSAMSHTLRRLRDTFDDPLLVRVGAGMVPTPFAERLAPRLRGALSGLARALHTPDPFAPSTSERTFRFASPDLFDALVLPLLLRRWSTTAPSVGVTVAPGLGGLAERLASGALDVAIAPVLVGVDDDPMAPPLASDLRTRRLLRDRFVAFVRKGHPALQHKGPLPAVDFAGLDHVLVSPTGQGDGVVDGVLAAHASQRRVALRVPHFASALAVVRDTDLVVVAPGALRRRQQQLGLHELPLSFALPEHALQLVWHPRYDADPGHRWFREQLVDVARDLMTTTT